MVLHQYFENNSAPGISLFYKNQHSLDVMTKEVFEVAKWTFYRHVSKLFSYNYEFNAFIYSFILSTLD